ncbi:hypothetical protein [Streptomyces sp. SP2-10]|uniref:hypothetical protein n=1 Tax=Streptomyces sp. SP2-10 TaxID=2873385 RepID=UPI001CA6271A|nr:hypothetical protein [Streptomyces sp. SP2-10]MBY8841970.1 hypothetical protein [Streptomyces sp. SP2-10]
MPRGRHRHSPPLHRLLPPSAIAGVSVVCALGPWAFSEATVLRALAAAAAGTAVLGAVVMRRWDAQAGRQVAELTRARAGDEWRYEERVAELETDLEESRELRTKLEQRLRAKRAELAGLRNEHAALLRRYATAETERATALEGRRLLELEAAPSEPEPTASSVPALPPARSGEPAAAGTSESSESSESSGATAVSEGVPEASAVFSAEGASLYRRALTALALFGREAPAGSVAEAGDEPEADGGPEDERTTAAAAEHRRAGSEGDEPGGDEPGGDEPEGGRAEKDDGEEDEAGAAEPALTRFESPEPGESVTGTPEASEPETPEAAVPGNEAAVTEHEAAVPEAGTALREAGAAPTGAGAVVPEAGAVVPEAGSTAGEEHTGEERAADGVRDGAGALPAAEPARPAGQPPAGHFTVPTAVAVVPAAPARRPVVEGGFDFFGTQKGASEATLDSVQNEDLADVVGPEALAVHKAESEAGFKAADERSRGVGQVIDLTAHDETEQIDVQRLRSAAS